jgi:hypothetical protein
MVTNGDFGVREVNNHLRRCQTLFMIASTQAVHGRPWPNSGENQLRRPGNQVPADFRLYDSTSTLVTVLMMSTSAKTFRATSPFSQLSNAPMCAMLPDAAHPRVLKTTATATVSTGEISGCHRGTSWESPCSKILQPLGMSRTFVSSVGRPAVTCGGLLPTLRSLAQVQV